MFDDLTRDPRVRVRTAGPPDPDGRCVVYWMQRAHRAVDNPALDTAIAAGNELGKPVVVFLGLMPFVERANLRHYQFLVGRRGRHRRRPGAPPCRVRAAPVSGPSARTVPGRSARRPGGGRRKPTAAVRRLAAPCRRRACGCRSGPWTPTWSCRRRCCSRSSTPRARCGRASTRIWIGSCECRARRRRAWPGGGRSRRRRSSAGLPTCWPGGRSTARSARSAAFRGGTREARRRLAAFTRRALADYDRTRNEPSAPGTSELSPYLHFGHIGPREVALAVQGRRRPSR